MPRFCSPVVEGRALGCIATFAAFLSGRCSHTFGSYAQGFAAAYPVVIVAALIFLLPGYLKRSWFLPTLAAITLSHVVIVMALSNRFAELSPSMFMLAFTADLLASLGLFIAVARLRNDPADPFEKVQTIAAPAPPGDKSAD